MPLFGKKDPAKKSKKDSEKLPSVEDKYNLKELLGTWVAVIWLELCYCLVEPRELSLKKWHTFSTSATLLSFSVISCNYRIHTRTERMLQHDLTFQTTLFLEDDLQ